MRCDECGRPMKNAELWQLASDPNAPTSRSMGQVCWGCRSKPAKAERDGAGASIIAEAAAIVRQYEATQA
jgi:hypothetical protein